MKHRSHLLAEDSYPINKGEVVEYVPLGELEKLLEKGIPIQDLDKFRAAATATNVPVLDHIRYLRALGALTVQDGLLKSATVPA